MKIAENAYKEGILRINPVLEDILNSYERDVEEADELNKILDEKYHITEMFMNEAGLKFTPAMKDD